MDRQDVLARALKLGFGYLIAVEIGIQYWLGQVPLLGIGRGDSPIPIEILLLGVIYGALYSLIAMGVILIYRGSRVINFSQAQLGAVPAVLAILLIVKRGLPWIVALPLAIVSAFLLGALVEVSIMRRFSNSPRLVSSIVTVGIGFLLVVIEFFAKTWVGGSLIDITALTVPTPFSGFRFTVGVFTFRGDHVAPVVVVAGLAAALAAFFKYSNIGIAIRACAENRDRAILVGIPAARTSTIVWGVAAVLSCVGVFFTIPLTGIPLDGFVGPRLLFIGLAIAVMARMESLPLAFFAGTLIGIIDQSVIFTTRASRLADPAIAVAIVASLLLQTKRISRATEGADASFGGVREVRPIPRELANLRVVKIGVRAAQAAAVIVAVTLPFWLGDSYVGFATVGVIYAIVGVSLVVLTGWGGHISLCQFAIAGVSSATAAGMVAGSNTDFFFTLGVATFVGAAVAFVIGLPALRVQGLFLAVVSLAFAFTVESMLNREYLGWLVPKSGELVTRPELWGVIDLANDSDMGLVALTADTKFYYTCLCFLGLALAVGRSFRRYRSGRVIIGVRDNGRMLQSLGVNLARTRLITFAVSGALAGMAGGLLAYQTPAFAGNAFPAERSLELFALAVIGGISSLTGAILGTVYVVGVPLLPVVRDIDQIDLLSGGIGLLLILMLLPGGLAEGLSRVRDRFLRRVAARYDILVPSLVADTMPLASTGDVVVGVPGEEWSGADAAEEQLSSGVPQVAALDGDRAARASERGSEDVPEDALLVCRDLEVAYESVQVLFGVNLHVRAGECVALLGTNGAGKSTLLRAVSGLQHVAAGGIEFDGEDLTNQDGVAIVKSGIVHVPGGRAIFPTLSVADHLRVAGWLQRHDPDGLASAAEHVLEVFPRLRERQHQMAGDLSGGEQQMLALGMALIARPKLLVIDELSLGLAPVVVASLLEIVRDIRRAGTAILLVEQSIQVALSVAERAYFLEKGEVRFEGRTADLLERDDIVRSVFLDGAVKVDPPGSATQARPPDVTPARSVTGAHVLDVGSLCKTFGGVRAVDGASFVLHKDEILGLIGSNGAGKTTVLDLVSGFLAADSGSIAIDGVDVTRLPAYERAWLGLGRSFQDARLVPSLTVAENIALGFDQHLDRRDHFASLLGLPDVVNSEKALACSVSDVVELMSLGAYRDKFVRELSTGTRRMADLAICLARRPSVLLLDEPASGVAQAEVEALVPLLLNVRSEIGCAMLVIEHDMSLISAISDRVIAFQLGRPIVEGTAEYVMSHPLVIASYLGGDTDVANRTRSRRGANDVLAEHEAASRGQR